MLRRIISLAVLGVLLLVAKVPRPLPEIAIPLPNGTRVKAQQYKGKVMVVMLFSTTCQECIASLNMLNKAQKIFAPRGFQALAAAVNIDAPKDTKAFVERYRPAYPTGYLNQTELLKFADLGPADRPFVPIFIFVDKHGMIRYQYFGNDAVMREQEKATMAIIDSLLKAD